VSLILDALRKADSERERESVPGLHTQPVPSLSLDDGLPPARTMPWRFIALGAIALLVAALAWAWFGRGAPPAPERAPAVDATAMSAPPGTGVAPVVVAPNAVAPNAPASEPPKEIAPPAAWAAPERKSSPRAPAKPDASATRTEAAAVSGVPAIYTREQLPDNIRAALPPLAVGGSIFSNTPANRSVILDGRLYRENDLVATDLQLEEIGMKTAVLRFHGYRFEIRY
jgi:general secretion pathway protein B